MDSNTLAKELLERLTHIMQSTSAEIVHQPQVTKLDSCMLLQVWAPLLVPIINYLPELKIQKVIPAQVSQATFENNEFQVWGSSTILPEDLIGLNYLFNSQCDLVKEHLQKEGEDTAWKYLLDYFSSLTLQLSLDIDAEKLKAKKAELDNPDLIDVIDTILHELS